MQYNVFSLHNASPHAQRGSFCVGVPCPEGKFSVADSLQLIDENGNYVRASLEVRHLWHDGSIKWLFIKGITSIALNETKEYSLTLATPSQPKYINPVKSNDANSQLEIQLSNGKMVRLSRSQPGFINFNNELTTLLTHFSDGKYNALPFVHITEFSYEVLRSHCHNVAVRIKHKAQLEIQNKALDVDFENTIFLLSGDVLSEITITNPAASLHPNGQWDLGDSSSIHTNELSLAVSKLADSLHINDKKTLNAPFESAFIHQASSGKQHWQSPVHVNAANEVNLAHKGFKVYCNGELDYEDGQCQPFAAFKLEDDASLVLEAKEFWQHFPSAMTATKGSTFVSLLGAKDSEPQELQPGEQITRSVTLSATPLTTFEVTLSKDWVQHTLCLPFTPFNAPHQLQQLVDKGIEGDNSFFHKRESIDEFGWRHFGELYADHEKALTPDATYFVSHYNNQYDPLSGMLYQWTVSGDHRWKELADNLAKHVANIDIYHTSVDKPEYSGGLFWHTDHYVPAHTAGHRTYSKNQPSDVYEDHAGGGGPGGQHCYTNGLLHHYLLTGSNTSKQALLEVCDWIERYYEGDGTLLNALLLIKNSGTEDLKNVKTGQYPLDRGTGNYLQALMDRYTLLSETEDLKKCARIIQHTVSPLDDISERNLGNVEATWFYTVFLQAVCRFIQLKELHQQNDYDYAYAVKALSHYVTWMVTNEYVYLEKPDILEFPNETWTGQDLRKLCLLAFAKAYLPNLISEIVDKKHELQTKIIDRLSSTKESETTRLLCLMMQNMNFESYEEIPRPMLINKSMKIETHSKGLGTFLFTTIRNFSLSKERSQAVKRFVQLQQWFGKP